jgi:hypothetical protein
MDTKAQPSTADTLLLAALGTAVACASGATGPTAVAMRFVWLWYAAQNYFQIALPLLIVFGVLISRFWHWGSLGGSCVLGLMGGHTVAVIALFASAASVGRGMLQISQPLPLLLAPLLLMGWFYGLCIACFGYCLRAGKMHVIYAWLALVAAALVVRAVYDAPSTLRLLVPFVKRAWWPSA